jgi:membrane protease subunit HflC
VKEKRLTILVAALVGALLVLYLVVFEVGISDVVVQYRFGRVHRLLNGEGEEAGWYLKLPYPIDTLSRFDRRVKVFEGKLSETTTSDKFNVIPRVYFAWRIEDASAFVASLDVDPDEATAKATDKLKDIANTAISQTLGRYPFGALVSSEPERLKLVEIEREAHEYLRRQAASLYHVEVVDFGIKWLHLPQDVTSKVFERMMKERQRVSKDFRSRGDAEAKKIVSEAEKEREVKLAEARAKAKMIVAEGETEAAKYLPVFAKNPELHEFLIKLDAMLQIARDSEGEANKPVFILDTDSEPWTLLKQGPDGKAEPAGAKQ